ncbi:MAG: type II secretion system F family protein [Candidatus Omnitrophota bacterium]
MKFRYRAKKGPDQPQEGILEASDYREAMASINALGLTPLEIQPISKNISRHETIHPAVTKSRLSFVHRIFQSDIVSFTRYLSDFISAGIPILNAIGLTHKYFRSCRLAVTLREIEENVRDGDSLSTALEKTSGIFSEMYINMIRAGEASGTLEATLERLAEFLERDQDNRAKVLSSLIYPALILSVGAVTIVVVMTWVLPGIMEIFTDIDQELPLITKVLMGTSYVFSHFYWLMLLVIASGILLLLRLTSSKEGRLQFHHWIFRTKVIGPFLREASMARFTRTLGTLITGGVDIVPALSYASRVISNVYIRKELADTANYVAQGESLSQAAARSQVFSDADINMISVGEETGALPAALLKLALFYERNLDRSVKVVTSMIEPGLILGLGLIIAFIVLAMLMPIFNMNLLIK